MVACTSMVGEVVDLRSDTVTKPNAEMREAMATAEVGDDVHGDDPTVAELENMAAKLFGKEAAVYVPSGTMGNLIAVMVHCRIRGSEMIVGNKSHMHVYEQGGCSTVAGVHPRVLNNNDDGTIALADIKQAIRGTDNHFPTTRLICIEQTHNICGGRVLPKEYIDSVGQIAKEYSGDGDKAIKLHIDGARIANAAVALRMNVASLCEAADSISCCLSKGLGAPVGSVLLGSAAFVREAKRARKVLGGGMRQVGVIAAPGIIALGKMWDRLEEDHSNAQTIAHKILELADKEGVADCIGLDPQTVDSNILYIDIKGNMDARKIVDYLKQRNILILAPSTSRVRMVTNHHVTKDGAGLAGALFVEALVSLKSTQ